MVIYLLKYIVLLNSVRKLLKMFIFIKMKYKITHHIPSSKRLQNINDDDDEDVDVDIHLRKYFIKCQYMKWLNDKEFDKYIISFGLDKFEDWYTDNCEFGYDVFDIYFFNILNEYNQHLIINNITRQYIYNKLSTKSLKKYRSCAVHYLQYKSLIFVIKCVNTILKSYLCNSNKRLTHNTKIQIIERAMRQHAAIIIQRYWKHFTSCPEYKICRMRLLNEYNQLKNDL